MKFLVPVLLVAVGLLNLYPVIGAISAARITELYGIGVESPDLQILMRHRAILLGLIGGFLIYAAFRPSLQLLAAIAGFISMASFIGFAKMSAEIGPEVNRVMMADIVGLVAIVIVLIAALRRVATETDRSDGQFRR